MNCAITEYSTFNYWDKMYDLFLVNKNHASNCNVQRNHKEDGESLGSWLGTQGRLMNKGQLDIVKQNQLEDISVV